MICFVCTVFWCNSWHIRMLAYPTFIHYLQNNCAAPLWKGGKAFQWTWCSASRDRTDDKSGLCFKGIFHYFFLIIIRHQGFNSCRFGIVTSFFFFCNLFLSSSLFPEWLMFVIWPFYLAGNIPSCCKSYRLVNV